MSRDCLDRRTLIDVAAGRTDPRTAAALQRHLPQCERCRAGIVAAARGELQPEPPAPRARHFLRSTAKLAAVAVSVLAAVAAWRYDPSAPWWRSFDVGSLDIPAVAARWVTQTRDAVADAFETHARAAEQPPPVTDDKPRAR